MPATPNISAKFGVKDPLMFLVSERLRVAVVAGHVPIKGSRRPTGVEKIIHKIKLMHQSLRRDFRIS